MPPLPPADAAAASLNWPRELSRLALVAIGCSVLSYAAVSWSPLPGLPIVNASAGRALAVLMLWGRQMAVAIALGVLASRWAWSSANCPHNNCLVVAGLAGVRRQRGFDGAGRRLAAAALDAEVRVVGGAAGSGGLRVCLGQHFAMLEMSLTAALLRRSQEASL